MCAKVYGKSAQYLSYFWQAWFLFQSTQKSNGPVLESNMQTSDGSVVSFQKTAVAFLASLAVFLKTAVAVVVVGYYIKF